MDDIRDIKAQLDESLSENPLRTGLDEERRAEPCTLVVFGASGDLTRRKLMPAIHSLVRDGLLHPQSWIVGFARSPWSDDDFREQMRGALDEHSEADEGAWNDLSTRLAYVPGNFDDEQSFANLAQRLRELKTKGAPENRLFYLATPPSFFGVIAGHLGSAGLVTGHDRSPWTRLIIEKPFGRDRASAAALNSSLYQTFHEDQIFRIDHYLGKETVQNILVFRLANGFMEPVWNERYIDHIQITVAETLGVGSRGGYYDRAGVLRDMFQNHMMQLLSLVCMEPPVVFKAKEVRDEKVKVLQAIQSMSAEDVAANVVRGQYAAGAAAGEPVPGYLEEENIPSASKNDTFIAARLFVETWRWSGMPIYVRSGKRLPKRATEASIVFKQPPVHLFRHAGSPAPNVLTLRVQPDEGISLSFNSKRPGQTMDVDPVRMDFSYAASFGRKSTEAYQRLLLDALLGDSTLFAREDEVDLAWEIVDAVDDAWSRESRGPALYKAGTWGPRESSLLLERDGRRWVRI